MNKQEFYLEILNNAPKTKLEKDLFKYCDKAIQTNSLLSRQGFQAYLGMDDAEFQKQVELQERLFSWFDAFAAYINMDRAANKMLADKAIQLWLLNEANFISSRAGDKVQTGKLKKAVLELFVIDSRNSISDNTEKLQIEIPKGEDENG